MHNNLSFSAVKYWTDHLRRFGALHEIRDDVEAGRIAHDIGLSVSELRALVAKGPEAAQLLHARMHELGLNEADKTSAGPKAVSNMQFLCATCKNQRRCHDDLQGAIQSDDWLLYCPNSMTLEAMRRTHAEAAPASA